MKCITRWEELQPNTMRGYAVKIEQTYCSDDIEEINAFIENCKKNIGSISITHIPNQNQEDLCETKTDL